MSAACFMSKVNGRLAEAPEHDVVLTLCCSLGSECVRMASGKEVVNPVRTLGVGYLDEDGVPRLMGVSHE